MGGNLSAAPEGKKGASIPRCCPESPHRWQSWTNTIGATELITLWKDPAFDAKYYKVEMAKEVPMTTTERAYTSPIWYSPLLENTISWSAVSHENIAPVSVPVRDAESHNFEKETYSRRSLDFKLTK